MLKLIAITLFCGQGLRFVLGNFLNTYSNKLKKTNWPKKCRLVPKTSRATANCLFLYQKMALYNQKLSKGAFSNP
jgi:hypothetical protein